MLVDGVLVSLWLRFSGSQVVGGKSEKLPRKICPHEYVGYLAVSMFSGEFTGSLPYVFGNCILQDDYDEANHIISEKATGCGVLPIALDRQRIVDKFHNFWCQNSGCFEE